ncbi:preprotein translocase subunit SecY [archaeon]|jgi:preprotein translocase subunit SecY|nr:preprotein translocase subunit SecY [archaeon]MBT4373139.1 preprotein translocase subunit SecY [archaeon]MBT4531484.1 preprotein translocase subunit SecY [archaeon]MBT7001338.1 preprotein translocase subunit SecY [archaeon]MBT7282176.1 preprotein translocase subunit SecY [archaeon]
MVDLRKIFNLIPEVRKPEEKKLDFNTKLKWTLVILGFFFVLANIPLFGLSNNALERFQYLAIIMGTDFGSIISLGIGPIVMASIILQLLSGAGIINIDQSTTEGKRFFQGVQKLLVLFFIIFEALVYVLMGGLQAMPGLAWLLIAQLILGGLAIFFMDEVCQKWGFGSGISLFIAAGVSWRLFTSAFQFVNAQGANCLLSFKSTPCAGKILVLIQSLMNGDQMQFGVALAALLATIIIFLVVVWAQSLKVEIPLSFGKIRGYGVKWPLSFFYASVLPVILVAALIANIQLFGGMLENAAAPCVTEGLEASCTFLPKVASYFGWLGHFVNGQAVSGLAFWLGSSPILELAIRGSLLPIQILQGLIHVLAFVILCSVFSVFWVKTSGMDSRAQAEKIAASGLQVAGFRQDTRILESILDRYIMPLTIMGGAAIGLLASLTNLLGALVSGTAILLVIMIMFQFYQNIAQQHMSDMNPAFRKFMGQ